MGWTEEIIGDWFDTGGGRRERTVVATKLYGSMGDWPNDGKLSALNIRRACDASLQRLRTDHIDLYQMHHVDRGKGAVDHRFELLAVAQFIVPFDDLAQHAGLIEHLLRPVDVDVAGSRKPRSRSVASGQR